MKMIKTLLPLAVLGLASFWVLSPTPLAQAQTSPGKPRQILFFSKSSGFEHSVISWKKGQPSWAEQQLSVIGKERGWTFTFSKDGSLFSPEYLKGFDAVLFYTTGDLTVPGTDGQPPMTAAGKQALLEWIAAGGAFAGTHSASDTFHTANEAKKGPDRYKNHGAEADTYVKMLGGEFIKHGAQQVSKNTVINPKFPGMEGLGDSFELNEEWYSLKDFQEDLHVLLLQDSPSMKGIEYQRPAYPSTWVRREGQGRVFYTSMGHREDVWTNPLFHRVLSGGLAWAMGDASADTPPNIKEIAPGAWTNPPFPAETPKPPQ
jgi:uncharacterized protein